MLLSNVLELLSQAFWWAWSHAARIKSLQTPQEACTQTLEPLHLQTSLTMNDMYGHGLAAEHRQAACQQPSARRRKSLQAHRLSLSCQRYTSEVAAKIRRDISNFDYLESTNPADSLQSHSLDDVESVNNSPQSHSLDDVESVNNSPQSHSLHGIESVNNSHHSHSLHDLESVSNSDDSEGGQYADIADL